MRETGCQSSASNEDTSCVAGTLQAIDIFTAAPVYVRVAPVDVPEKAKGLVLAQGVASNCKFKPVQ